MPGTGHERRNSLPLLAVKVGERFTGDEIPHLPPVELVQKLPCTWVVAEVKPDGGRDRWTSRLIKAALFGKTPRIMPQDFGHTAPPSATLPPISKAEEKQR